MGCVEVMFDDTASFQHTPANTGIVDEFAILRHHQKTSQIVFHGSFVGCGVMAHDLGHHQN